MGDVRCVSRTCDLWTCESYSMKNLQHLLDGDEANHDELAAIGHVPPGAH